MKRYEISYKEPEISKEQIERHKDFAALAQHYQAYKPGSGLSGFQKLAGLAIAFLILATISWLVLDQKLDSSVKGDLKIEENTSQKPSGLEEAGVEKRPLSKNEGEEVEIEEPEQRVPKASDKKAEADKPEETKATGSEQEAPIVFMEASPIGGMQELYHYFNESLVYPTDEMKAHLEGTVILSFSINTAGRAENIQVVQAVSPGIDLEAIRLIEEMPDWKPASIKGQTVSSRVTLPVTFIIAD